MHQYRLAHRRPTPDFTFYVFLVEARIAAAVNYACTTFGLFVCVFFPWGIPQFQNDWSSSCDDGLDYASQCENNNSNNAAVEWTPPAAMLVQIAHIGLLGN